jgi:hypothetical protein
MGSCQGTLEVSQMITEIHSLSSVRLAVTGLLQVCSSAAPDGLECAASINFHWAKIDEVMFRCFQSTFLAAIYII